jgi:hypothetical protein
MGDEMARRTKKALLAAMKQKAEEKLSECREDAKGPNPFLNGVPAVVDAIVNGQIGCRVYNQDKFHAKA